MAHSSLTLTVSRQVPEVGQSGSSDSRPGLFGGVAGWPMIDGILAAASEELLLAHGPTLWQMRGGCVGVDGRLSFGPICGVARESLNQVLGQHQGFQWHSGGNTWAVRLVQIQESNAEWFANAVCYRGSAGLLDSHTRARAEGDIRSRLMECTWPGRKWSVGDRTHYGRLLHFARQIQVANFAERCLLLLCQESERSGGDELLIGTNELVTAVLSNLETDPPDDLPVAAGAILLRLARIPTCGRPSRPSSAGIPGSFVNRQQFATSNCMVLTRFAFASHRCCPRSLTPLRRQAVATHAAVRTSRFGLPVSASFYLEVSHMKSRNSKLPDDDDFGDEPFLQPQKAKRSSTRPQAAASHPNGNGHAARPKSPTVYPTPVQVERFYAQVANQTAPSPLPTSGVVPKSASNQSQTNRGETQPQTIEEQYELARKTANEIEHVSVAAVLHMCDFTGYGRKAGLAPSWPTATVF